MQSKVEPAYGAAFMTAVAEVVTAPILPRGWIKPSASIAPTPCTVSTSPIGTTDRTRRKAEGKTSPVPM